MLIKASDKLILLLCSMVQERDDYALELAMGDE